MSKKIEKYERIIVQLKDLFVKVEDPISRMSTISAILHNKMNYFFWTGFYRLEENKLIVGSYQGPLACLLLKKDVGVCWAAINQKKSILVPEVAKFPGHIACNSKTKSEIVVLVKNRENKILGALDIDSISINSFDKDDQTGLEKIANLVYNA